MTSVVAVCSTSTSISLSRLTHNLPSSSFSSSSALHQTNNRDRKNNSVGPIAETVGLGSFIGSNQVTLPHHHHVTATSSALSITRRGVVKISNCHNSSEVTSSTSSSPKRNLRSGGGRHFESLSATKREGATLSPPDLRGEEEEHRRQAPSVSPFRAMESAPAEVFAPGDDLPLNYADEDPSCAKHARRCGILLHPSSLPGSYGIGELGDETMVFLDWLKGTGCTLWQVLPLVPPGRKGGEDGSPYAGSDANCGNTLLISLEDLVKEGLLEKSDLPKKVPVSKIDFDAVAKVKDPLIAKAARNLVASKGKLRDDLEAFRSQPNISVWLEEAALFDAIDKAIPEAQFWWQWPVGLRDRDLEALEEAKEKHASHITHFIAEQFLFQMQWQNVHNHATSLGIRIIGDMPIYVGAHSADVWANRTMFALDTETGAPAMVSGVPPDLFSETGQLWGSPLYNWKEMEKDGYTWWANRMRRAFELYDEFRIDHFRGLAGYWAIDAAAETAVEGKWQAGPREGFFDAIQYAIGRVDIIAEDLGVITPDVISLRKNIKAPGMVVIQFAFGGGGCNPHLPHYHEEDMVVYTGTHDNDTVVGWWNKATDDEKEHAKLYLNIVDEANVHWDFIRSSISSVAYTCIIPLQDVMGLGDDARMNTPATQYGNWGWRVGESGVITKLQKEKKKLRALLKIFNRVPGEDDPVEEKPKPVAVEAAIATTKPATPIQHGNGNGIGNGNGNGVAHGNGIHDGVGNGVGNGRKASSQS